MTLFVAAGFVGRNGYLSEAELREISKHPLVTVGAHGLWHRHFPRLPTDEARVELVESRRLLESITGTTVDLMAWPYGECNDAVEELSKESGYRAAWSVWQGTNSMYSRRRVPLGRRDNMVRFIAKVSGAYALTKARWHRRNDGINRMRTYLRSADDGNPLDEDPRLSQSGVAQNLPPHSKVFD